MRTMLCSQYIMVITAFGICALTRSARAPAGNPKEQPDEIARFAARVSAGRQSLLPNEKRAQEWEIDEEKLGLAIQRSAWWIRTVLKEEFIPDDLESLIEGIPGGMEGRDIAGKTDGPRYDCTTAEFEKEGYRFLVTQEAGAIAFFVVSLEGNPTDRAPTPDALVRFLRERFAKLFRHGSASLYLVAIKLTDYGVNLDIPWHAQYADAGRKGWATTVVVPPKACDDGVMAPSVWPRGEALGAKLREIDPAIPKDQSNDASSYWWGAVGGATDGRVLYYSAGKLHGGQSGGVYLPDWFRITKPGEIPDTGSKVQQTTPDSRPAPPK